MLTTPRESDVRWTIDLFNSFSTDVAYWGVPFNRSIYRIDRSAKTAELVYGPAMGPNGNMFEQLKAVCRDPRLGYQVSKNFQSPTTEIPVDFAGFGKSSSVADEETAFRAALAHFCQRHN